MFSLLHVGLAFLWLISQFLGVVTGLKIQTTLNTELSATFEQLIPRILQVLRHTFFANS